MLRATVENDLRHSQQKPKRGKNARSAQPKRQQQRRVLSPAIEVVRELMYNTWVNVTSRATNTTDSEGS